ncbi:MAG: recombinase family protein [Thiohalomonadales bacterium]
MKIGYERISSKDQNFRLPNDALNAASDDRIYTEVVGSAKKNRDDVFVVWKLDRLGWSPKHFVALIENLMKNDVGFKSTNDPIDTTWPQGRLIFNIFASLAEFERNLI